MQVDHLVCQGEDLSGILYKIDESDLAFSQFEGLRVDSSEIAEDDCQITPNSILEDPLQYRGSSCSCSSETTGNSGISQQEEIIKKKKKKNSGFLPGIVNLSLGNRRKGAPQRAPLS